MKKEIEKLIGEAQVAKVERRAKARGIKDIWGRAMDRARLELPDERPGEKLTRRAAVRAQQIVGSIPRWAEGQAPAEAVEGAVPGEGIQEPGSGLPPVATGQSSPQDKPKTDKPGKR